VQYYDRNLAGYTDIKEVFEFITNDDKAAKVELQNGDWVNYLPTKNFKLHINADELVKNGVVTPEQKSRLLDTMKWKYTSNYVTKDNLAMMDIMAHNNWKRPICFTITVGQENMAGLQPYLYKEGFTYRLIPFKPDTASRDQLGKTNSLVMYNNIMTKFKWGNFKTAKYLDPESNTMFYPVILATMLDLVQNLKAEGHVDLARNVLKKYDEVMPDIYPFVDVARNKYYLVSAAYELNDAAYANKYLDSMDKYIVDQLDYNASLVSTAPDAVDPRTVQLGLSLLNGLNELTKEYKQTAQSAKLDKQFKEYQTKFASIVGSGR